MAGATTNIDTITDFVAGLDQIEFVRGANFSAITGPTASLLNAAAFYQGAAAHDADDRVIYDPGNGGVFYDADGNGAGASVRVVTIATGLSLTNADFYVY